MSDDLTTTDQAPTPATQSAPATPYAARSLPDWFNRRVDDWILDVALDSVTSKAKKSKVRDEVRGEIVSLAHALAGPTPGAAEWQLATTAALAYLAMRRREAVAYADEGNSSMKQVEYRARMLNHATNRFNALLRTLAAVRRAGSPAVQVNIAGGTNQTNIGMP